MNNDSTPIELPRTEASTSATTSATTSDGSPTAIAPPAQEAAVGLTPALHKFFARTRKRSEVIQQLLNNLDTLIYLELCITYYMDCSLFRLIIRAVSQMMMLTPKPAFIQQGPLNRPYLGFIFIPNILCMLLHTFTARSEAGEAMRGYLHGGVIVDLIGQKGPTSKIHLLLLDILVLGLQCFMLSVHLEHERLCRTLRLGSVPPDTTSGATGGEQPPRAEVTTIQDHDAEERGVVRDEVTNNGHIELQPLTQRPDESTASGSGNRDEVDEERNQERERLLAEPLPRPEDERDHVLDVFWSGTAVLADFHILYTIRRQWAQPYEPESALQSVGFSAGFANQRLNARFRAGARALTI